MTPRRLDSIDILRGLVMVIMALDHVRANLANPRFDPADLSETTPGWFLTRWVSHFCAPTFVLLAGTGAFLAGTRGKGKGALAWFLLSRGLWLVLLELTVVRFSWFLNVDYFVSVGQVIWAIGWSMVLLSGLVFLPVSAVTVFGVCVIAFHNLFDGVRPEAWGAAGRLWQILHAGREVIVFAEPRRVIYAAYPVLPWAGVMAVGYGLGALMLLEPARRRKELLGLGISLTVAFVALRYANLYGDKVARQAGQPGPWSVQPDGLFTVFSFVNCQKYPPSLVFVLMTLGPAIAALALFDRELGPVGRVLVLFGRVPLFFYLLHFYLIKGLAIGLAFLRYGRADWMYGTPADGSMPSDYGYDLWVIYPMWILVVVLLYPLCRWFAGVKSRSRSAWLSYL